MNRYEVEVADRLGHYLLRDHAGDTRRLSSAREQVRGDEEGRVAVPAPTVLAQIDTPVASIDNSVGAGTVGVLL